MSRWAQGIPGFFYRNPKNPDEIIERSYLGNLGVEFVEKLRKEFNLGNH